MSLTLVALLLIDLEPLRQRSADLKIEKETFPLIHASMSLRSLRLSLWISVLRVGYDIYLKHSRPIPPVVVNTSGVKDACSTSKTRRSYILFFSFHEGDTYVLA